MSEIIEKKIADKKYAVSIAGVSKRFGSQALIIKNLWLDIEPGELLVLSGPSGCGKTTTLRMIAGFLEPDSGSIRIDGREVAGGDWVPPERRAVGMVFQDYALFPHLTVEVNVGFGLSQMDKEKKNRLVSESLHLVGLEKMNRRYPHELSGGEQQRVALARALAPEPKVILLDEPFSNLDAYLRSRVREEVRQILKHARTTTIFVTHDQEEALALADRVAVFNKGELEQIGTPEEVYHRPTTRFVADFIGQANFLSGTVESTGIATELGMWPSLAGLNAGREVNVMLRPHDVKLAADKSSGSTIASRQFLGEENLYIVGLPSGQKILSTMPSHTVFQPGDKVKITINRPQAVVFLDDKVVTPKKKQLLKD